MSTATTRSRPRTRGTSQRRLILTACLAVALLAPACLAPGATASATPPPIERVWSFNGGEVAIRAQPGGGFLGTVVAPTRFATCTHPIGEAMWTSIEPRPDGSYWGFHRWLIESIPCAPQPQLGPAAWRVMSGAGGSYLLVCLGSLGGAQPMIAPNGTSTNVGFGCLRSAEIAPVDVVASFQSAVSLPDSRRCVSRRDFRIHLHQSRYDPFQEVVVRLAHRRLRVHRQGNVFAARIDLRGLPRGTFTVRIRVTTVLGHQISGSRRFHTCALASTTARPFERGALRAMPMRYVAHGLQIVSPFALPGMRRANR